MLDLESAIKHCEEKAEELEEEAVKGCCDDTEIMDNCIECASEHRQLAEWLRELKALREDEEVQEVFKNCDTCKHESLPPDSYPCDRCCHRYLNQYEYDNTREVNADVNT